MRRALPLVALLAVLGWAAGAAAGPAVKNGKIAFVSGGDIWVVNPDGSGLQNLTHSPAREAYPTWSPEGTRIVYSSNRGAMRSLWIMNADGGDPRRLTHLGRGVDTTPSLSPDGRRVVFARRLRGNQEIYVMNLDGTGLRRLTRYSGVDFDPSWSPDGSEIVFWRALRHGKTTSREIFAVEADGSGLRRLTWGADSDAPAWAPDGKRIAFTRHVRGQTEGDIWVMRADGTGQQRIASGAWDDDDPAWAPDGSAIAFASDRADGTPNIYLVTMRTPRKVSRVTKPGPGAAPLPRGGAITPAWQPVP